MVIVPHPESISDQYRWGVRKSKHNKWNLRKSKHKKWNLRKSDKIHHRNLSIIQSKEALSICSISCCRNGCIHLGCRSCMTHPGVQRLHCSLMCKMRGGRDGSRQYGERLCWSRKDGDRLSTSSRTDGGNLGTTVKNIMKLRNVETTYWNAVIK